MNENIRQLHALAWKPQRTIIGLMSGTSFDGLDIAYCRITGHGIETKVEILQFETISYPSPFREKLKTVFSKRDAPLEEVCLLNPYVGLEHGRLVNSFLKKWDIDRNDVDLVASHGQTIYHAPKSLHGRQEFGNATLQIGDGDHIAVATGIITISDFRQKHIAAGGEGAPLAVYGDYFIFSKPGENRIMLNIGGIANFTFLPSGKRPGEVFSTDIGPGNTMMDAVVQKYFPGKYFDEHGKVAQRGHVNDQLLLALRDHPFFNIPFPKTVGPELFNIAYLDDAMQRANTEGLAVENILATLNRFTAGTIADAITKCPKGPDPQIIYASGGGMHNPVLMENLRDLLPGISFRTTKELDINPDAKEAVLFAILANECVSGSPLSSGSSRPGIPAVTMGKISFPE